MPLSAILDEEKIYSFNYSNNEWNRLKNKYHEDALKMYCCESKAIPKTSKLGTKFFAHSRKRDCKTAPETIHHLYLKNLVVETALKYGWEAKTEVQGETPEGERWVADTLCEKNSTKVAIEIQWSYQQEKEFRARQRKYRNSGIRAAWLFRVRGNQYHSTADYPYEPQTPVFLIMNTKEHGYHVPQFGLTVEKFIDGIFTNKLRWIPRNSVHEQQGNELVTTRVFIDDITCQRCGSLSTGISGVKHYTVEGFCIGEQTFYQGMGKLLLALIPNEILSQNNISIKKRFSEKQNNSFISNGCTFCDGILDLPYSIGDDAEEIYQFQYDYKKYPFFVNVGWYFNGIKSRDYI